MDISINFSLLFVIVSTRNNKVEQMVFEAMCNIVTKGIVTLEEVKFVEIQLYVEDVFFVIYICYCL